MYGLVCLVYLGGCCDLMLDRRERLGARETSARVVAERAGRREVERHFFGFCFLEFLLFRKFLLFVFSLSRNVCLYLSI